ncbi:MAG: type II toxin-antitoxin system RelE family toxin [Candidatus Micrarchaeales archaeon]
MSYQVTWSQRSRTDLEALDNKISKRIIAKVESIKEQPFSYVKHLVGVPLYSLRIGDYRVIMDIKNKEMVIFVIKIGHRSKVYGKV